MLSTAGALEGDLLTESSTSLVTPTILESKIAEVEAAADMPDDTKSKLVELYRKALNSLQTAKNNEEAAETFRRVTETAPVEMQALRERKDEAEISPSLEKLKTDLSTPLDELERLLQKEKANLAAVDTQRAEFEQRLSYLQDRPSVISQRLTKARQQQEEVAAALKTPSSSDQPPSLIEAKRWALWTKYKALSTEIKLLDQELLSHPMRVDLLEAKRD
ncbi:MAG: mechanosensitive ion channel protein MscS, partial [Chromatiales bacterium]